MSHHNLIELTAVRAAGTQPPTIPVLINPASVASLEPRRTVVPDATSQTASVKHIWRGSRLRLIDGTSYELVEEYADVKAQVWPEAPTATVEVDGKPVPESATVSAPDGSPEPWPLTVAEVDESKRIESTLPPIPEGEDPATEPVLSETEAPAAGAIGVTTTPAAEEPKKAAKKATAKKATPAGGKAKTEEEDEK